MVVREILGKVLRKIPYVEYLLTSIIGHDNDEGIDEPLLSLGISISAERSPRDIIHNRLISK